MGIDALPSLLFYYYFYQCFSNNKTCYKKAAPPSPLLQRPHLNFFGIFLKNAGLSGKFKFESFFQIYITITQAIIITIITSSFIFKYLFSGG